MNIAKQIDVVYTWCGSPETKYCKFNKDLYYSIKSVRKFMPWVRKIWVLVPDSFTHFDAGIEGIEIVKESQFVPKKYLPIHWNSNVIESWIWRIKGIAEHFVYFCDDMYVGRPVKQTEFFLDGKPVMRIYDGKPDYPPLSKVRLDAGDYVRMWAGAVEKYGLHYTRIQHQALPYKKSLMKAFYKEFEVQVNEASKNKVRKEEFDFNLLRFTSALSVMRGKSLLLVTYDDYDFFTEFNDIARIKKIPKIKPAFFCINNSNMATGKRVYYPMFDKYFGN